MGVNGAIGAMLQGVSQQPFRIRLPGKVGEQINLHSDVNRGLISRPAAVEVANIGTEVTAMEFDTVVVDDVTYIVGFHSAETRVWDLTGTEYTVTPQDANATAYMGDNMGFHVYDDTIYITNRDVVVASDSFIDTTNVMLNQGLVQCLGGSFGRNMHINITYSDETVASGFYNIPDSDPDKVNGDDIMDNLVNLAVGALVNDGDLKGTTTLTLNHNVLLITDSAFEFTLTVEDGEDNSVLRGFVGVAKKLTDLTKFAPHGTLVKVEGEDKTDDDFYMRFEVVDETTVGDGFGITGLWREWVNAEEAVSLDLTTMPHILFKVGSTFFYERNLWLSRRAGDSDSNDHPSFVGETIKDIGGFQSRLAMIAGPNFITSRTNIPADFYKKSVVTESDSDPIDIASTTESEKDLRFIVPFDQDLLLLSDKHQFIVPGTIALTPKNSQMRQTTDFEMAGDARPSSTGITVIFPYTVGLNAGLNEFFASGDVATNGADNLMDTLTSYVTGAINQIETNTNEHITMFRTDAAATNDTVWIYKYIWEQLEKKQSSFSKWTFFDEVAAVFWEGATIYIIFRVGNDYILCSMDMSFPAHAVGFNPTLDRRSEEVVDGSFQISLAYSGASFVQYTGCDKPGQNVTAVETGSGPYTYTFDENTVPAAATVIAGISYTSSVTPTMPFAKHRDGKPNWAIDLVVGRFKAAFENSGAIQSTMASRYRATDTVINNDYLITENNPDDLNEIGIRDGVFDFPWGEQTDRSNLTLDTLGIRPMALIDLDFDAQRFKRGVRIG